MDGENSSSRSLYLSFTYCESLGKLKDWRRAKDGDNKLRPFGFAIFEDAESTNRGFHLLEELEIPNLQGKKGSKLIVYPSKLLWH
jgi:hypothetical protein